MHAHAERTADVSALTAVPVGDAGDGVDPGCDGGEKVLEDVLAAAVLIEFLGAPAFLCPLPLAAPSASTAPSLISHPLFRLVMPLVAACLDCGPLLVLALAVLCSDRSARLEALYQARLSSSMSRLQARAVYSLCSGAC